MFGLACAAVIVLFAKAVAVAADAVSTEQLMKDKKESRWSKYAESHAQMRIEGRLSAFSPKLLRLLKCDDLDFVWHDEDQSFPVDPATFRPKAIEVFGRFSLQSGKPVFLVEQIRVRPTDEERLQTRKAALSATSSQQWFDLGDWAQQRGQFYNDSDLQLEAKKLYAEALQIERNLIPKDDVDAKIALSKKFVRYSLGDEDRVELVHDALCTHWLVLKEKNPDALALERWSDRINEGLDGCKTPLGPRDELLRQRYWRDPIGLYRTASTPARLRLNRVLYSQVRLAYLQTWARQEGRDGLQLADRMDRDVPEFHADAEALRSRALDEKLAAVKTATRDELLHLVEQFAQRGESDKALQAKKTWVTEKEKRSRSEGRPDDLVQAAHEYRSLLDDNETAVKLLLEAHKLLDAQKNVPGMKTVADELVRLGWTQINGNWMTREQADRLPPDPSKRAAEAGRFVGMSRDQLRKAQGNPDSMTRIISAGHVCEVWIYNAGPKLRLAIHLADTGDSHGVKVVRMFQETR